MRTPSRFFIVGALICVGIAGCANTRAVSSTPEYKPWIGKEVSLSSPGEYHVIAPKCSAYKLEPANLIPDCPILGEVGKERKVIIEAVKETKGTYLIGGPFTRVHLTLSIEHPLEKNKRIKVGSELNVVEPFRDRVGQTLEFVQSAESSNKSPARLLPIH